jgi:hypothetical protein
LNEEVEIEKGYFVKFNTLYLISKTRRGWSFGYFWL